MSALFGGRTLPLHKWTDLNEGRLAIILSVPPPSGPISGRHQVTPGSPNPAAILKSTIYGVAEKYQEIGGLGETADSLFTVHMLT